MTYLTPETSSLSQLFLFLPSPPYLYVRTLYSVVYVLQGNFCFKEKSNFKNVAPLNPVLVFYQFVAFICWPPESDASGEGNYAPGRHSPSRALYSLAGLAVAALGVLQWAE